MEQQNTEWNATRGLTEPPPPFSLSYERCLVECGSGLGDINWKGFSQTFGAWLLPWIALMFQMPFGAKGESCNFLACGLRLTYLHRPIGRHPFLLHHDRFTRPCCLLPPNRASQHTMALQSVFRRKFPQFQDNPNRDFRFPTRSHPNILPSYSITLPHCSPPERWLLEYSTQGREDSEMVHPAHYEPRMGRNRHPFDHHRFLQLGTPRRLWV